MTGYIFRRLLGMALNLVLVSTFVFAMMRVVPGDTAIAILGQEASLEQLEAFRDKHNLNGSLVEQYVNWGGGVITGDFGSSLRSGNSVTKDFFTRLPITLEIVVLSFTMTTGLGILTGIWAARAQNTGADMTLRVVATLGISVPNFVLLTLLLLIPARLFNYAPPFGATSIFDSPIDNLRLFVPPTLMLAIGGSAVIMRYTRSGFLEVMRQDYIRTARSKGLSEGTVAFRHALRNALPPIMTLAGLQLGGLLGGSVILERIMSLPGLGSWLLQGIGFKDYPVVMIVALYSAFMLMIISLIIDVMYAYVDPRIRYA
jgi:peptide/nickel transport system permease protein